jgi:hypothetical protein
VVEHPAEATVGDLAHCREALALPSGSAAGTSLPRATGSGVLPRALGA